MIRIALRSHRRGMLTMSVLGALLALANTAGFLRLVGTSEAERLAFAVKMEALAHQVAFMIPLPVQPETVGGYLQWRGYGAFGYILAFWAVLAAAGAARGEEDLGLAEIWLAAGVSRVRLVFARFAAFAVAAAAVVSVIGLAAWAGAAAYRVPLDVAGLLGKSAALFAHALACYGIAFAAAQLAAGRRSAAAAGGAMVFALFLLDSMGRTVPLLVDAGASSLSVFGLYHRTTSLAPSGRFDAGATAALLGIALAATALAAAAFARLDLYAPLFGRRVRTRGAARAGVASPLAGLPVLGRLWEERLGLLAWAGAMALLAFFMISIIDSTVDLMLSTPTMRAFLRGLPGDPRLVLSGTFMFSLACMLLAVFAIVQVALWAEEDASGRLEMILAQPVPRWHVVADRALALAAGVALLAAVASGAFAVGARLKGIPVAGGRLVTAAALLLPFALTFGAAGAVIAAFRPRLATFALAAAACGSFFLQFLGPPLDLPRWLLNLSVFELYGAPLLTDVSRGGLAAMVATVAIGFGAAMLLMQRREVGR